MTNQKTNVTKKKDKSIEKTKQELVDLTETLQRLQADYENFKKRVDKEKEQVKNATRIDCFKNILPVLDAFDQALKTEDEKIKGSIKTLHNQITSTLTALGIKPIQAVGKQFDPELHEVMIQEKSEKESGTVLKELHRGYMLNGLVLRHSKVKVSK